MFLSLPSKIAFIALLIGLCQIGCTKYAPEAITDISVIPGDSRNTIVWKNNPRGQYYTIYWSNTKNLTKTNSQIIKNAISPFKHQLLRNGEPYYYALMYSSNYEESLLSKEIMSIPTAKDSWKQKASMSSARNMMVSEVVNGKIYVIGGYKTIYYKDLTNVVEEYNPLTNLWTTKASMPIAKAEMASAVVNNKIYIIGGRYDSATNLIKSNTIEEYDPITDIWTTKYTMKNSRSNFAAASINGMIYIIGGYGPNSTLDKYDPINNTMTSLANLPTPRFDFACSVLNEELYVIGGIDISNGSPIYLRNVEKYNPTANSWTKLLSSNYGGRGIACSSYDGKIYKTGGSNSNFASLEENAKYFEVYDSKENDWTLKTNIQSPRYFGVSEELNGKIYVIGGNNSTSCLSIVEAYTP